MYAEVLRACVLTEFVDSFEWIFLDLTTYLYQIMLRRKDVALGTLLRP